MACGPRTGRPRDRLSRASTEVLPRGTVRYLPAHARERPRSRWVAPGIRALAGRRWWRGPGRFRVPRPVVIGQTTRRARDGTRDPWRSSSPRCSVERTALSACWPSRPLVGKWHDHHRPLVVACQKGLSTAGGAAGGGVREVVRLVEGSAMGAETSDRRLVVVRQGSSVREDAVGPAPSRRRPHRDRQSTISVNDPWVVVPGLPPCAPDDVETEKIPGARRR